MGSNVKIWVVDDERLIRVTLADDLKDNGFIVREFSDGQSVLAGLSESIPDIVITDLKMPGIDGVELLTRIKKLYPDISIIVMTAHGTLQNAVEAMKLGAYDYITKPFNKDEILITIDKITELSAVQNENKQLKKQLGANYDFPTFIGTPESNQQLFDQIKLVLNRNSTVLITGETGTGKELVTSVIHYNSNRKTKPFVKVSCAILSREIFESELFGHVKGAFTGAENEKQGRFELAHSGTLYLDDIDDIPLDLQVKLLRVLEQQELEKVGSSKSIPIDVRLIASTKKDLRKMVVQGKFREDLFYRLNIFPINLTPLRERKKDIEILLNYFVQKFSNGLSVPISKEAMEVFKQYHWPGNVRELKNMGERLAIISGGQTITASLIPHEIRQTEQASICNSIGTKGLEKIIAETEITAIKCALEKKHDNKTKAAELLRVPLSTLRSKMEKYGL